MALADVFNNDDVKGTFFLTILPKTMDYVVDNLSTSGITSFSAMQPKFLDIAEKHNLGEPDSSAYYTATNRNKTGRGGKPNGLIRQPNGKSRDGGARSQSQPLECSYYLKRSFNATGHDYYNYNKLAKERERNKSNG